MRGLLGLALLWATGTALAAPPEARMKPALRLLDPDKGEVVIPGGLAQLVFYEDQKAGVQNLHVRSSVAEYTRNAANRGRLQLVAVADVEKWNWWPANDRARKAVRESMARDGTPIYLDWKGEGRRLWGLTPGKSGVLLLDGEGNVRFSGEGPLAPAQVARLLAELEGLGIKPSAPASPTARDAGSPR